MIRRHTLALALVALVSMPAAAYADGLLIPFLGVNFGGDSGKDLGGAVDSSRFNWGVSLSFMGAGVIGIEADFSYTPDFYGKSDLGGSSVLTGMGNLVVGVPFGGQTGFGVRPYGVGGVGVIRSDVSSLGDPLEVEENQFGWNFGGGVMIFFGRHAGIRGDIRYFRAFEELEFLGVGGGVEAGTVDFTRGSLGFIFRF